MRIHSRRNPRRPSFTPEQEAEYERFETLLARARIIELGVAAILGADHGTYLTDIELREASRMLANVVGLRAEALSGRADIRKAAEETEAVKPKRKAKA